MSRPNPNPNRSGSDQNSGHKIYAWIVATSAFLLLGLLIWPMTVDRFEATSVFQFRYDPTAGIEKTSLNNLVVETLREQTERSQLADIFSNLESTLTSDVLQTMDPEQIRGAIKIQGRPGDATNSVEYRMSLVGEGSPDEIEFINELVSKINHNLPSSLIEANHSEVVSRLTRDYGEYYDGQLQLASAQLNAVINNLDTFNNDIKIVAGDLRSITEGGITSPSVLGRPTNNTLGDLERLKTERDRLIQLHGNQFHPMVAKVQLEIERLQTTNGGSLSSPMATANNKSIPARSGQFQVAPGSDAVVVKNRFVTAANQAAAVERESNTSQAANPMDKLVAPLGRVIDDIKLIDLTSAKTTLTELTHSITDNSAHMEIGARLNRRAVSELQFESPIALSRIEIAERSSPIQRAPNMTQFLWMLGFAGLCGTVLALNYDPACRKRRFRSVEQVSRKLSLPVVGMLRSRKSDRRSKPIVKVLAAKTVRICEWTLLGLAVLLILAALANSQVAAAFIENPFHGITRTFWLMTGR